MKEPNKISSSEITDPAVYFNRRTFMRVGILAASAFGTGLVYRRLNHAATGTIDTPVINGVVTPPAAIVDPSGFRVAEPRTSVQGVTHYK